MTCLQYSFFLKKDALNAIAGVDFYIFSHILPSRDDSMFKMVLGALSFVRTLAKAVCCHIISRRTVRILADAEQLTRLLVMTFEFLRIRSGIYLRFNWENWLWKISLQWVVSKQIQNALLSRLLDQRCAFLKDRLLSPWGIYNEQLAWKNYLALWCKTNWSHWSICNDEASLWAYKSMKKMDNSN